MFLVEAGRKYIKSSEELVSMLLGLAIVVVIVSLLFNFVQRGKGTVEIPGSTDISLSEEANKEPKVEDNIYTVVAGDSLWKIAERKYNDGYTWVKIAQENNLGNAGLLAIGQKLKMPDLEEKNVVSPEGLGTEIKAIENKIESGDYQVMMGDSLWKIAVRAYGDGYKWVNIWQENKTLVGSPDLLEIGMTLKISKL